MKKIHTINFKNKSQEELLPDFQPEFPYISSYIDFSKYLDGCCPWHWHGEIELFYIEDGTLEYYTPSQHFSFPAGSGGFINSNVLHMTVPQNRFRCIADVHLFDTMLISGSHGSLIEQKYVAPLVTAIPQLEILGLYPEIPEHLSVLSKIRSAFTCSESEYAYELKLRSALSDIWYQLLDISRPLWNTTKQESRKPDEKIKQMISYIQKHYTEHITVAGIAASAYLSQRACYRVFHDTLHMTPLSFLTHYRLQQACILLTDGSESITCISHGCGLGSSSYFCRVFREQMGCTPMEYRSKWQDIDINRQD